VEVSTGEAVTACDANGVEVGGERIEAHTILWAAGVAASPIASWLDAPADRAGRVMVREDLSVPGHPEIFAIGDTCASLSWDGKLAPGVAPAAKQMGGYAASVIRARVEGASAPPPFTYRHQGSLATIGRNNAVADFGWMALSGWPAWLVWSVAHIFFLIGFRSRIVGRSTGCGLMSPSAAGPGSSSPRRPARRQISGRRHRRWKREIGRFSNGSLSL